MYDKGNRALLWLGDPKLVVMSAPAPHLAQLRQAGYQGTRCVHPDSPSPSLCRDVAREPGLLRQVVQYAAPGRRLQLVPYATTVEFFELVERLRRDHGLEVLLPESPSPDGLWLRDYLDTKAGFRHLVGSWLEDGLLPEGFVCQDAAEAERALTWLTRHGHPAIVKASRGNGGFGHTLFDGGGPEVRQRLEGNAFFRDDLLIVEERIVSPDQVFPAIEMFVPPSGSGQPRVTHVCTELFLNGKVTGQIVTPELALAPWRASLDDIGRRLAAKLQAMGYVGIFDVDAVVDSDGRLYLLEMNTRRSAGTHAHEFACFAFGPDYASRFTVICHNTLSSGRVSSVAELVEALDGLLYRAGCDTGIVITHSACLRSAEFGCIIVAPSSNQATSLQTDMLRRIDGFRPSSLGRS